MAPRRANKELDSKRHVEYYQKKKEEEYTHSNNGVQLCHGDLFRSFHSRRHLLLVFLREERKDLRYNSVQSFSDFSLKYKKNSY